MSFIYHSVPLSLPLYAPRSKGMWYANNWDFWPYCAGNSKAWYRFQWLIKTAIEKFTLCCPFVDFMTRLLLSKNKRKTKMETKNKFPAKAFPTFFSFLLVLGAFGIVRRGTAIRFSYWYSVLFARQAHGDSPPSNEAQKTVPKTSVGREVNGNREWLNEW